MKIRSLALASLGLLAWSPAFAQGAASPDTVAVAESLGATADAINRQGFVAGRDAASKRRVMIRAQIMLDRLHFSPGVIDGVAGSNMRLAVRSFQSASGLRANGRLDRATWDKLVATGDLPALRSYTIAAEDVAGPMEQPVKPGDYGMMAERESMGWTSTREALAERAHMDEALLVSLNPGVDLTKAGASIIVANVARDTLAEVATIEVDKANRELRALGADGKVLAVYPATVGSAERPAPAGEWAVRTVAMAPTYTFDPARLTFKSKGAASGKHVVPAGPNNPVGGTWIDLTKDTYGIHGAPDPRLVGKVASHGCVRLTNWDARELALAVKAGTKVIFAGKAAPARG